MNTLHRIPCVVPVMFLAGMLLSGCSRPDQEAKLSGGDSLAAMSLIAQHRAAADSFFRFDASSPFLNDSSAHFDSIKWFPPDVAFLFRLKLTRYPEPAPVTIFGTKGEPRREVRYGYFVIPFDGKEYRLNAYKSVPLRPGGPLSVVKKMVKVGEAIQC